MNASVSWPLIATFITSIHAGRAASAPVSFGPSVFFSSKPTQTPQVIEGEKPTNQASVKSLVVPVFPAERMLHLAGRKAGTMLDHAPAAWTS